MGRPAAADPVLFEAAAAAGVVAADAAPRRDRCRRVTDRLERLVNLTATLLATRRPITLDELAERLEPPYPAELAARRRQFERDKDTLRGLGIQITVEPIGLGGELGYRIRPADYYLPDPGLTQEERAGAARRGDRRSPRGWRRPRGAAQARRDRGNSRTRTARRGRGHARARSALRRRRAPQRAQVHVPRRDPRGSSRTASSCAGATGTSSGTTSIATPPRLPRRPDRRGSRGGRAPDVRAAARRRPRRRSCATTR